VTKFLYDLFSFCINFLLIESIFLNKVNFDPSDNLTHFGRWCEVVLC